jgi:hypothetical protein
MCYAVRKRRYRAVGSQSLPCAVRHRRRQPTSSTEAPETRSRWSKAFEAESATTNDRDIALDMNWRPGLLKRGWPSPAGIEGKRGLKSHTGRRRRATMPKRTKVNQAAALQRQD